MAREEPSVPPLRGKIVAVSDSLTNDQPENWLALVAARSPALKAVANAHGGWTTKSFFKEKFKDVAFARVPPDAAMFILLLGSNNLFEAQGGSDEAVAEAVAGIERLAAHLLGIAPRAEIVLAAPPTVALSKNVLPDPKPERRMDTHTPQYLRRLSRAYRALAARRGWRFVDLLPVLTEEDFADAAHPNAAGNRKMADAVWAALTTQPRPATISPR
jgi:lysophospholipase L1-like esterase